MDRGHCTGDEGRTMISTTKGIVSGDWWDFMASPVRPYRKHLPFKIQLGALKICTTYGSTNSLVEVGAGWYFMNLFFCLPFQFQSFLVASTGEPSALTGQGVWLIPACISHIQWIPPPSSMVNLTDWEELPLDRARDEFRPWVHCDVGDGNETTETATSVVFIRQIKDLRLNVHTTKDFSRRAERGKTWSN